MLGNGLKNKGTGEVSNIGPMVVSTMAIGKMTKRRGLGGSSTLMARFTKANSETINRTGKAFTCLLTARNTKVGGAKTSK
jgi:hypothetical protein